MKRTSTPGYDQAQIAARRLRSAWRERPRVAVVLGSGLGGAVRQFRAARRIPYDSIPYFPRPTTTGHAGVLHLGRWGEIPVAVLEGRMHLYEGYGPSEVAFPVRVMARAGVETVVLTCAAGGIRPQAVPGSFMLIRDHLNLLGQNPLAGPHDARWGERFVDMTEAYDPGLRRLALRAARALRLRCFEGVYAAVPGPSFETPAEIRALRRLGADAVGMSVVPEVLAARQMQVRVLGLAAIANRAAGLSRRPVRHDEVLEEGANMARNLVRLLDAVLPKIAA